MIDYKKFEGHRPGPWRATYNSAKERAVRDAAGFIAFMPKPHHFAGQNERYEQELAEYAATNALITAAPDLLEENKRLREALEEILKVVPRIDAIPREEYDPHGDYTELLKINRIAFAALN